MIASNSRNAGKTTFACKYIAKWSKVQRVVAIKVTSIRQGEAELHGSHSEREFKDFDIYEELSTVSGKDTARMLIAGADKVYYIRCADHKLEDAFEAFNKLEPQKPLIVCESRNLRKIVKPGALVMFIREPAFGKEKDVSEAIKLADKIYSITDFSETNFDDMVDEIIVINNERIAVKANL